MMQDDNRLGALPTLNGIWKSSWRGNTLQFGNGPFYCCLIVSIRFDRMNNQILLYLDARGEGDLRPPQTSGIWVRDLVTDRVVWFDRDRIRNDIPAIPDKWGMPSNISDYEFESHPSAEERRDRHKGVLKNDSDLFSRPGHYQFCYANATPSSFRDYNSCNLFTVPRENGLMEAFECFSLRGETPFDADTPQSWDRRWLPYLPGAADLT